MEDVYWETSFTRIIIKLKRIKDEYFEEQFWVLVAILLLTGSQVIAQNIYKWTDELELLKRVDKLPEYRTDLMWNNF